MRYLLRAFAVSGALGLVACNPTFNWREVRPDTSALVALLPCKPDEAVRTVELAGEPVSLDMLSCDAGGATFAIGYADIHDRERAGAVLAWWRAATLANLRATVSTDLPFMPKGSVALPQSTRVTATGQRADGGAVKVHAAWFAQRTGSGVRLFQAVVYANKIGQDVSDTFFSSLRLQ
ncbi:MAG: hypothetical protein ABI135_05075 [Rhodoferax sp.]